MIKMPQDRPTAVPDEGPAGADGADGPLRPPLTEAEIGAMIVDEVELTSLGRWAGAPPPRRRRLGR